MKASLKRSRKLVTALPLAALALSAQAQASGYDREVATPEARRLVHSACLSTHKIKLHDEVIEDVTVRLVFHEIKGIPSKLFVRYELYGQDGYLVTGTWSHTANVFQDGKIQLFSSSTSSDYIPMGEVVASSLKGTQTALFTAKPDSYIAKLFGTRPIEVECVFPKK